MDSAVGEQQAVNGSGGDDVARLRQAVADVPVSVVHLAEAEPPNRSKRPPVTLCGAELDGDTVVENGDVRYCGDCAEAARRWATSEPAPSSIDEPSAEPVEHPSWCSPEHCYVVVDEGDDGSEQPGPRVHHQHPQCWEDPDAGLRVQSQLLAPEDDIRTYLELELWNLLTLGRFSTILALPVVRRLRDHLDDHLAAAEAGRRNRVAGGGRLVHSSE